MLAGGRGKGRFANYPKGGVQLLFSADEIEEAAKGMIGNFKFKNNPIKLRSIDYIVSESGLNWGGI